MNTKNKIAGTTGQIALRLAACVITMALSFSTFGQRVLPGENDSSGTAKNYALTSFNVRFVEGKAYANWKAVESNSDCLYLLESSCDKIQYKMVTARQGFRSPGNAELLYSFEDENPASGISYYRIRRFSKEGCTTSNVVEIQNNIDQASDHLASAR